MNKEKMFDMFTSRVYKTDTCWIWKGFKDKYGYGVIKVKGKFYKAHRLSFMLFNGEIPEGLLICHKCNIRDCVNPEHIYAGTGSDNQKDAVKAGTSNFIKNKQTGSNNYGAKLNEEQVKEIKKLIKQEFRLSDIASLFKVTRRAIGHIKSGRNWKHVNEE